jgi:hypothetical protein
MPCDFRFRPTLQSNRRVEHALAKADFARAIEIDWRSAMMIALSSVRPARDRGGAASRSALTKAALSLSA